MKTIDEREMHKNNKRKNKQREKIATETEAIVKVC